MLRAAGRRTCVGRKREATRRLAARPRDATIDVSPAPIDGIVRNALAGAMHAASMSRHHDRSHPKPWEGETFITELGEGRKRQ